MLPLCRTPKAIGCVFAMLSLVLVLRQRPVWDVVTGQQIGPAMKRDSSVNGAVLTKDERRILCRSRDHRPLPHPLAVTMQPHAFRIRHSH
jgi:hypothetical protein